MDRGLMGELPFAAMGSGPPVVVLAGLSPTTGVDGDWFVRASVAPFRNLAEDHRIYFLNRRAQLPRGITMAELATEHAESLAAQCGEPVDVIGISTGGSIAQQLAADHPQVVRRLALISTACRLGPATRREQVRVATHVRAGETRAAARLSLATLVPPWRGQTVAGVAGWLLGPRLIRDPQAWRDMATTIEAEDSFDLGTCAAPIVSPTIILGGARDRFYPLALFEETARIIPNAQLMVLPRRGHITVLNDRTALAALGAFLRTGQVPEDGRTGRTPP
ncbi:MAG: alpha/beta hydrolase [Jatrophihabitans sp.]